jgi:hypothetical protein
MRHIESGPKKVTKKKKVPTGDRFIAKRSPKGDSAYSQFETKRAIFGIHDEDGDYFIN